jgi:uncharacterized protein
MAWLLCLACLLTVAHAAPLPASPTPHYIRDDAKWLSPADFKSLDEKLKAYERDTSSQIVVGIFPSIPEGEELFDYTQQLFEAWQPGLKGKDNGVLFVIFANDRKTRIHTGYGMEGVLPDARSNQIIRNVVAPQLRLGNRVAAINGGVDAMIAAAKGEYTGTGKTQLDGSEEGSEQGWIFFLVVAFFVGGFFFPRLFAIADIIFTPGGPVPRSGRDWSGGNPRNRSAGGWGGGSSGGGWGGSSGGGFSGGGGSSGGGGASGDW